MAVAVIQTLDVQGHVVFTPEKSGVRVRAVFSLLPSGDHGFHIHKAGDLREKSCAGACDHWSLTPSSHGGTPRHGGERHTGDLGNISGPSGTYSYFLEDVSLDDLYGRSVIVHADRDDLGRGHEPDSHTTGHSGARIACAIIGRASCNATSKTRRRKRRGSNPR
jgi:Cu-Zn family superoxide dismutase